ncbi:MAG: DUF2442 domain-containing protein [Nitrospirota bacterium]
MRSKKPGKNISASVENITPFGIWLLVKNKEYFLPYRDYPYFQDRPLYAIQKVQLLHEYHLYWPELDIDLEVDVLEHPEHYPLVSKTAAPHAGKRVLAHR